MFAVVGRYGQGAQADRHDIALLFAGGPIQRRAWWWRWRQRCVTMWKCAASSIQPSLDGSGNLMGYEGWRAGQPAWLPRR